MTACVADPLIRNLIKISSVVSEMKHADKRTRYTRFVYVCSDGIVRRRHRRMSGLMSMVTPAIHCHLHAPMFWRNSGSLNLLEPKGPIQACIGGSFTSTHAIKHYSQYPVPHIHFKLTSLSVIMVSVSAVITLLVCLVQISSSGRDKTLQVGTNLQLTPKPVFNFVNYADRSSTVVKMLCYKSEGR